MNLRNLFILLTLMLCVSTTVFIRAAEPLEFSSQQIEFFENKIRPLIISRCIECHGADVQESELRLDSRTAILKSAVEAKIGTVLSYAGEVKMPPDGKLSDTEIAAMKQWIAMKMPWPSGEQAMIVTADTYDMIRQQHWSFQPVQQPAIPAVQDQQWPENRLDYFVLAKLEAVGLAPSPTADRRTLIRRVMFDLVGLPPTPEQVAQFINDKQPSAYERMVDRILALPQFGERWGRHWLDVARYSDTVGYNFMRERRFPFSYTYRDYVIRAINEDRPYDEFVQQQLAADLLVLEDKRDLAAMGFLTVGRQYRNQQLDVDDKIDTVTRGVLGLTVACARCHDHKYDAVATEDYYSLYGVFASSNKPAELPLIQSEEDTIGFADFRKKLAEIQADIDNYDRGRAAEFRKTFRSQLTEYWVRAVGNLNDEQVKGLNFLTVEPIHIREGQIKAWRTWLVEQAQLDHPVLGVLKALATVGDKEFTAAVMVVSRKINELEEGTQTGQINPVIKQRFIENPVVNKIQLARLYGDLLQELHQQATSMGEKLTVAQQQVYQLVAATGTPTDVTLQNVAQFYNRDDNNKRSPLVRKIDKHKAFSSGNPPRAMVLQENPNPHNPRVFIRGKANRKGESVPRQFLYVLTGPEREPYKNGSGRLELAQDLSSPNNPLTRRVLVNRLWMHHFGSSLAVTPSDFGVRCSEPVQRDVMDHLATLLLDHQWSMKAVHREIVLSATYRQSSNYRPEASALDPENGLYWRMNRQRLEYEIQRDSLLAVLGELDLKMGGLSEDLTNSTSIRRRAVYTFIDRQDLPNLLRVFDFPNPDQHNAQRSNTTVPQQALFLMNSPAVLQRVQRFVASTAFQSVVETDRIEYLYQRFFQRLPSEAELQVSRQFVEHAGASQDSRQVWQQLVQLLLMTNEFNYRD
jgi:cytochrome c553